MNKIFFIIVVSLIFTVVLMKLIWKEDTRSYEVLKDEMIIRGVGKTTTMDINTVALSVRLISSSAGELHDLTRAHLGNIAPPNASQVRKASNEALLWILISLRSYPNIFRKNDSCLTGVITREIARRGMCFQEPTNFALCTFINCIRQCSNKEGHISQILEDHSFLYNNGPKPAMCIIVVIGEQIEKRKKKICLKIWSDCKDLFGYTDIHAQFAGMCQQNDRTCLCTESSLWAKMAIHKMLTFGYSVNDNYLLSDDLAGIEESLEDNYLVTHFPDTCVSMAPNSKVNTVSNPCALLDVIVRNRLEIITTSVCDSLKSKHIQIK